MRKYDIIHHSRQTYSLLDLLGDCGGLLEILRMICSALLTPFVNFSFSMTLASTFFRMKKSPDSKKYSNTDVSDISATERSLF